MILSSFQWLTKTILIPLTREIDNVNQSLIALGHTDIVIGSKSTFDARLTRSTLLTYFPRNKH